MKMNKAIHVFLTFITIGISSALVISVIVGSYSFTSNNVAINTNITDWQGCHEDEVTVVVTIDPLNQISNDIEYCVAKDDMRLKK